MNIKKETQKAPDFFQKTKRSYLTPFIFLCMMAFLSGGVSYKYGFHQAVEEFLNSKILPSITAAVNNYAEEISLYKSNNLDTLYIDIPFDSLHSLNEKRKEAINIGILFSSDEDYVPAEMHINEEEIIEVDVRLKGDWTDHLEGEKWSLRVHVENDDQLDGMTNFSLQSPETRLFINEWVFHENMARENIMTTRYKFVNVLLNGENYGVYALEESFTEVLIESQERRQGVIINFDEDMMWRNTATFWENSFHKSGEFLVTNIWTADISGFRESHVASSLSLSAEASMAKDMLYSFQRGERNASEIFDVELMGKYFALCDLWHASHSTTWHNMRFYYNPISGLLEPIGFDGDVFYHLSEYPVTSEIFLNPIFDDLEIRRAYGDALKVFTSDDYINQLEESFSSDIEVFQKAMSWEYRNYQANEGSGLQVPWDVLRDGAALLRDSINPQKNLVVGSNLIGSENPNETAALELEIKNYMALPVDLIGIKFHGQIFDLENEMESPAEQSLTILPEDLNDHHGTLLKFYFSNDLLNESGLIDASESNLEIIVTVDGVENVSISVE